MTNRHTRSKVETLSWHKYTFWPQIVHRCGASGFFIPLFPFSGTGH